MLINKHKLPDLKPKLPNLASNLDLRDLAAKVYFPGSTEITSQIMEQMYPTSPNAAHMRPDYNPGLETGLETGLGTGSSWLGRDGYLGTGATVANALSGLAGAYTGWKALKLGEEQFDWQKAAANRDLENQGLAYNTALMDRAAIGARLGGKNEADTAAILAAAEKNKMNTRPI